jgi:hypothetical protein
MVPSTPELNSNACPLCRKLALWDYVLVIRLPTDSERLVNSQLTLVGEMELLSPQ